jgi:hypothetical protein
VPLHCSLPGNEIREQCQDAALTDPTEPQADPATCGPGPASKHRPRTRTASATRRRAGWNLDSPGDEELDGLSDGEANEGGDEGVIVEDGEVGEPRTRCRRRGGGGAISTVPHGWTWTWTEAARLLGRSWPALPKSGRSTLSLHVTPVRSPRPPSLYLCSSLRARRGTAKIPRPLPRACVARHGCSAPMATAIGLPLYSTALWSGRSSHSQSQRCRALCSESFSLAESAVDWR